MKTLIKYIMIAVLMPGIGSASAQTINWASLNKENRHIINAGVGYDFAFTLGAGYGYQFRTKLFPILVSAEFSFPSGSTILDDFKAKIGGQTSWVEFHNFQFSTRIYGVFRRIENDFVRMANFGSDLSGIIGYYRSHWFVAGEVGFDKAIVTNFKNSNVYKEQYPDVLNGWYEPSTGGNFYFGLQAGCSFGKHDFNVKAGKMLTQDFKTTPMIPLYVQLGYNIKF